MGIDIDRSHRIAFGHFWARRARRLLPALYVMMASLAVYMAFFRQRPMGQTRGDLVAGLFYGIKPAVTAIVVQAAHRVLLSLAAVVVAVLAYRRRPGRK